MTCETLRGAIPDLEEVMVELEVGQHVPARTSVVPFLRANVIVFRHRNS